MKKYIVFLLLMSIFCSSLWSAKAENYIMEEKSITTSQLDTFRFLQFTPQERTKKVPLIIYLHGGSGKGDDIAKVRSYLFPSLFEDGTYSGIEAYAVCPQVPSDKNSWLQISASVFELIDYMCENYNIDERKISLIGHSMGGTGTWSLAAQHPERFCCIVPMSGSIENTEKNRKALGIMPIRAFVGSADTIVRPETSTEFVSALTETNSECTMTVFEGATHFDVPDLVLKDESIDIINWVLSNEQKNTILTYGSGRVGAKISVPGRYTLIFADYENGLLQNIYCAEHDFEYGRTAKQTSVSLSSGDCILLWNTVCGAAPEAKKYSVR